MFEVTNDYQRSHKLPVVVDRVKGVLAGTAGSEILRATNCASFRSLSQLGSSSVPVTSWVNTSSDSTALPQVTLELTLDMFPNEAPAAFSDIPETEEAPVRDSPDTPSIPTPVPEIEFLIIGVKDWSGCNSHIDLP